MKILLVLFSILFLSVSIYAQKSIEGIWDTGMENTKIEIKAADSKIEGKIYASDNSKAPKGKLMVKDVSKNNQVYKGKLYIIKKDRWVDAVFVRTGDKLIVTISAGFQKKTVEWELVK